MRIAKKFISFLLAAAMAVGMLPTIAFAAEEDIIPYAVEGGNIYFDTSTGTVTDCDESVTSADIPESIEGVDVTGIGDKAFYDCNNLVSVTLPDGVTSIGDEAFADCSNLSDVNIPDSVTSIGERAFEGCSGISLEELQIGTEEENEPDVLDDAEQNKTSSPRVAEENIVPYAVEDGNIYFDTSTGTIMDCDESVAGAEIPERIAGVDVTGIGMNAFAYCEYLTDVTIAEGITSIGFSAFAHCTSLTSITIPDSVTSIDSSAFRYCDSLTNIKLPDSITYIGYETFYTCFELTNITIPDSVTSIGYRAFDNCISLTNITIPDSVTSIGYSAFAGCSNLTSITIPSTVTNIERTTFWNCSSLTSITIPSSVTCIDWEAFRYCDSLTDVYYSGSEADWDNISIAPDNECLTNATIHYNSTGPDDPGAHAGQDVYFLSQWNPDTRQVLFDDGVMIYTVADDVDTSNMDSLVNRYVLATTEQGEDILDWIVTDIQLVESKIGTVSATGEHSMTIDGVTYPVQEDLILGVYEGKEILYHIYDGTIMDFNVLEEKTGILEAWDSTTKQVTIDGIVYPTNYLSDLSFQNNISDYLQKSVCFVISGSLDYCPLFKITDFYYPGGKLEDFDPTIYHASWLAKNGNADSILRGHTPSDIMMEQVDSSGAGTAMDVWRSFELVFDSLGDITTLAKFATGIDQKDMYSALILTALEAKVSYDIIPSQAEEGVKLSKSLISNVSSALKADYGIDLNNDTELYESLTAIFGNDRDMDVYLEEITKEWFKNTQPDLGDLGKSLKWISKGVKAVGTAEDYAEYISACITLSQTDKYIKEVLNLAYQKSSNVFGPANSLTRAFKECLDMFSNGTEQMFDKIQSGTIVTLGEGAVEYIVGNVLWSEVTDYINVACPEVAILQIGYTAGKTISSWLCNTDDAVEQYLKMDSITDIESVIDSIYNDLRLDFGHQKDVETAATYLSAMALSFQLRNIDCNNAYKYVDAIDTSLLNKIEQAFGKEGNKELKQAIQDFQNVYQLFHVGAETDWIFCLENDYPGSGLYEQYEQTIDETRNRILKKQITAACPVNMYVFDQTNHVVASVIGGRVNCSVDDVMIALVDNQKIIRFYDGADYRIEYIGYDAGDMDVTITEFNENKKAMRTVNYYNLALTNGKTYTIDANDDTLKPYNLVDKTNNSTVQHDYDSMDTNAAHTIKIISGTLQQSGELFAETTASKGETLQLNAYVPEGYEFIRWESSSANALIADINSVNTILIMPDEDLIVTAIMRETQNPSKDHIVTLNPNGGTINVNTVTTDANGKLSSLPMPTRSGYTFNGWFTAVSGGEKITTDYVFTSDTTVYAHWTKNDGNSSGGSSSGGKNHNSSNSVTTGDFAHGSVNVSPPNASKGTNVTLTIQPDHGYALDSLVVKDAKGNSVELTKETDTKYTFIMPDYKVTIDATFKKIEQQLSGKIDFIDVLPNDYYFDAVQWAVEQGITAGTSNIMFSPDAPCTRAQIITFLWRAAGSPLVDGNNLFIDVPHDSYYYNAVQWAVAKGIAVGTSAKTFSPDATCTRGQAMTFLYRYEKTPVVSGSNLFTDVDNNKYYANAVQWAAKKGITAGTSAKTFHPNATCTRAQIVTFLYRNMA